LKVEVFNSKANRPIYTTVVEVDSYDVSPKYEVYRNDNLLAANDVKAVALALAAEKILAGFKQPGFYRAVIDGVEYAQREAR